MSNRAVSIYENVGKDGKNKWVTVEFPALKPGVSDQIQHTWLFRPRRHQLGTHCWCRHSVGTCRWANYPRWFFSTEMWV